MMEMDPITQTFGLDAIHGGDDGDDEVLEDLGFFALGKAHDDEAQRALNELGLAPSSPVAHRRVRSQDSNNEEDEEAHGVFDLDYELEMEERQRREEAQQPTPYFFENDEEDEEEVFESNGILETAQKTSQVQNKEKDGIIIEPLPPSSPIESTLQAHASTSRLALDDPHSPLQHRSIAPPADDDQHLGMNGLPKYIPAGLAHVVLLDGSSVRFERRKRVAAWRPKPAHYGAGPTGLLSRPVHRIVEDVEALTALQVVQRNEAIEAAAERARAGPGRENGKEKCSPAMWQERYRPGRFSDLIGEERTHRDVMSWLKSWDKCVFGRKAKSMRKRLREAEVAQKSVNYGGPGAVPTYSDKWDRPKERILLLGGPAGMGKTTLAHVAAKTSGYLVHEINASDDRSARTVEERVREALESNSLHANKAKQPTCLILDEVDGATGGGDGQAGQNGGGGFIRALIKLVEGGNSTSNGKRKGKSQRPLLRPIICVCNDPYAPALRALRPYSKLVRLNRPTATALMARLRHICEREEIRHDTAGLNTLISLCQGDVRSCLNALQLVHSDPRGVTMAALQSGGDVNGQTIASALSIKDGNSNIHQVWQRLLRTHTSRERDRQRGSRVRGQHEDKDGTASSSSEAQEVVACVISSGEMDKVLAGCFEHYPNLKLVDDGWWRFRRAHDWIHWYEHLNQRGWEIGMHTDMWAYLPWSFVCWRQLFANTANELPDYPRVDYQNHLMRVAFDEMTLDVQSILPVQTRCQFDKTALTTELGPMLVPLMTPDLKPINSQLVRAEEKATLTACVTLMHSLNVDFVLDKNAQGHSYYRFDPPLEAFAHFEGKRVEGSSGTAARFNVRQMITTELRALRVRNAQQGLASSRQTASVRAKSDEDKDKPPEPKEASVKAKGAVDFFGRPIVLKAAADKKTSGMAAMQLPESIVARRREKEDKENSTIVKPSVDEDEERLVKKAKLKVFYHYHEGYSNAVRKPIKMSSFLS